MQFHPELTDEILEGWLADADEAELRHLDGTPEGLLAETAERQEQARPHTDALVDHFLARCRRPRPRLIEALAVGIGTGCAWRRAPEAAGRVGGW